MRGKRLGFSIEEIQGLINLYDVDATESSQLYKFLEMIRQRQQALRQQQTDISETLSELDKREGECEALLGNTIDIGRRK
jgi:DNA-binding transcriptional MerR regulator